MALVTLFIFSSFCVAERDALLKCVLDQSIAEWSSQGFVLVGQGGGFHGEVRVCAFSLSSRRYCPTTEEARAILVKMIQRFTSKMNGCRGLRPYLKAYPFSAEQCIFILFFDDPKTLQPVGAGKIQSACCMMGHLSYVRGGEDFFKAIKESEEETYEEALLRLETSSLQSNGDFPCNVSF